MSLEQYNYFEQMEINQLPPREVIQIWAAGSVYSRFKESNDGWKGTLSTRQIKRRTRVAAKKNRPNRQRVESHDSGNSS